MNKLLLLEKKIENISQQPMPIWWKKDKQLQSSEEEEEKMKEQMKVAMMKHIGHLQSKKF